MAPRRLGPEHESPANPSPGTESPLHQVIVELLSNTQTSISGIARELQNQNIKLNKLILTGYLRAMEDFDIITSIEIPPSKVYTNVPKEDSNIYNLIGKRTQRLETDRNTQILITIYILQQLFHRSVFDEELRLCGFSERIKAPQVTGKERKDALAAAKRVGLEISGSSPLYSTNKEFEHECQEILKSIVIEQLDLRKYLIPVKQTTLEDLHRF